MEGVETPYGTLGKSPKLKDMGKPKGKSGGVESQPTGAGEQENPEAPSMMVGLQ